MNTLIRDQSSQEIRRPRRIGFLIYPDWEILMCADPSMHSATRTSGWHGSGEPASTARP